jgi:hypothetical protein
MSFVPIVTWSEEEKQSKADKTRWSNFWLLMNTNQAGENVYDQSYLVRHLRASINRIFSQTDNVIRILKFVDKDGVEIIDPATRTREAAKIEKVESEAVIEIGPKVHRIHCHLLLIIQHKTRIQINVPELRVFLQDLSHVDEVGFLWKNPIVRVKHIKENPINAIRKYQRGYKNKLPTSLMKKVIDSNKI